MSDIEWEGEEAYKSDLVVPRVVVDPVLDAEPEMDMAAFLRGAIPDLMRRAVTDAVDVKEIVPVLNMAQKLIEAHNGAKGVNEWKVTVEWV